MYAYMHTAYAYVKCENMNENNKVPKVYTIESIPVVYLLWQAISSTIIMYIDEFGTVVGNHLRNKN